MLHVSLVGCVQGLLISPQCLRAWIIALLFFGGVLGNGWPSLPRGLREFYTPQHRNVDRHYGFCEYWGEDTSLMIKRRF